MTPVFTDRKSRHVFRSTSTFRFVRKNFQVGFFWFTSWPFSRFAVLFSCFRASPYVEIPYVSVPFPALPVSKTIRIPEYTIRQWLYTYYISVSAYRVTAVSDMASRVNVGIVSWEEHVTVSQPKSFVILEHRSRVDRRVQENIATFRAKNKVM